MTALADFPGVRQDQRAGGPVDADAGPAVVRGTVPATDRPGAVRDRARSIRSWPLVLLAFPAAAEVWSGWVGLGSARTVVPGLGARPNAWRAADGNPSPSAKASNVEVALGVRLPPAHSFSRP
jgi:hypothetical protein